MQARDAQSTPTPRPRSLPAIAAALLIEALGHATPAAAQGVIATGAGRAGATVAGLFALAGVVVGGLGMTRAARRTLTGRDRAVAALVLGLVGMVLGGLHLATTTGGFGTGNGRAGAIVAVVLGVGAMVLGRLALTRAAR